MKKFYFILFFIAIQINAIAQNLHEDSNAVSPLNESNSTAGWSGLAQLFSESADVQNGNFSFRAVSTATDGRTVDYNFNAVVGQQYVIRIWAKLGAQSDANVSPAFAVWSGMSGFNVTPITSTTWTEYVFNVTATATNPRIRIYTSNYPFRFVAGNTIYVDNVSILALDNQAPSSPTNLSATATTATSTNLTWTAATDNVGVTNYEVFQNGTSIGLTGGSTSFLVSSLTSETTYTYTVSAIDASNNASPQSTSVSVTTLASIDTEVPSVPTGLIADNITTTSTNLNWIASIDNIGVVDYEVFQDGVSLGFSGGSTTYAVNGLNSGTTYNFTVSALDAAANASGQSNGISVNTLAIADAEAPTVPTNLVTDNITTTSVNLNWAAATDNVGVVNYEIFQDGVSIGLSGASTTFAVNGLTPETTYNFTVAALDAAANTSLVSESIAVLTLTVSDTEAPGAPTGLIASNTTETSTELSWDAATDNVGVTDYEIFQDGVTLGLTGGTTNFTISGLTSETTYVFTVLALDVSNNASLQSSELTVVTLAGVQAEINYTSLNANLDTIDWTVRDLYANQNVGIGTTNTQGYRLAVAGNVVAEEVKVALQVNWPDYVFDQKYELPSLKQVEKHINENGYLMDLPSAAEVQVNGILLGEMNAKLLRKIEELTLYAIIQDKKIELLAQQVEAMQQALSNK